MKKYLLLLIVVLPQILVAQNLQKCTRLANGGWQAITKDIAYTATAALSGTAITAVHRFSIFYTDEPHVTGSILTFAIVHSDDWSIPEGATVDVRLSDGSSRTYKNKSNGTSSVIGSFYRSEISIFPETNRLVFMDKISEIRVKISDGRELVIKPGVSWSDVFADAYFEMSDALKSKGWTKGLL